MTSPPPSPRIDHVLSGIVMVVTDLHGDWPLYQRYRDVFLHLRSRGLADVLVFTGDLIHSDGPAEEDGSLDIVLDLIDLQGALGPGLIVLLGNHEMPHIYHVPLIRGEHVYTPRFEAAMGTERDRVLRFLRERPFYVCTQAGVALCHAGAFPEAPDGKALTTLAAFSHQRILDKVEGQLPPERRASLRRAVTQMTGESYAAQARAYLAVDREDDPRYDDYLRGILAGFDPDFKLLWSALFSRNEHASGTAAYQVQLDALLTYLEQSVMVAGHIGCRGGYRVLAEGRQLRLASGAHAHPYTSARFLLFDAGKPVRSADDLLPGLGSIFEG